jgi:hypothetical protein
MERAKLEKGNAKIRGQGAYTPMCDGKCAQLHKGIGVAGAPARSVRGLTIGIWLKNNRPGRWDPSPRFLQRCDSMRVNWRGSAKDVILKGIVASVEWRVARSTPPPGFFVSIASKEFSLLVKCLESTLMGVVIGVDFKRLTEGAETGPFKRKASSSGLKARTDQEKADPSLGSG